MIIKEDVLSFTDDQIDVDPEESDRWENLARAYAMFFIRAHDDPDSEVYVDCTFTTINIFTETYRREDDNTKYTHSFYWQITR